MYIVACLNKNLFQGENNMGKKALGPFIEGFWFDSIALKDGHQ